jgi:hypothetical protein
MSMRVDPQDGRCRSCGGTLEITDADDATLSVQCTDCDDAYLVETDAFGDGCMKYYLSFMSRKLAHKEDEA